MKSLLIATALLLGVTSATAQSLEESFNRLGAKLEALQQSSCKVIASFG
jgi:hypothetical protein